MPSCVAAIAPAAAEIALAWFDQRLKLETDCWDVHHALTQETVDFVLLDVRSAAAYRQAHVPGAVSLPHASIAQEPLAAYPADTLFVVYCAGPHCNGATRAVRRLAELGRPVKEMIGGLIGWRDEGFPVAAGAEAAALPRTS